MILPLLFAFGAMLFWGIGDFLIQRVTRKVGNIEALAWIGIIGTIGLLPFAWKDLGLVFSGGNFWLFLLLGAIVFASALFNFEALKKGKLSVIDVVLEIELPITIFLSFVFFKEVLSLTQAIVIVVIMSGIILIATKSFSHFKAKLERGVLIALVASVLYGAVNFLTAVSSKSISPMLAIWAPWMIMTILCLVVIIRREGLGGFISNAKNYKMLILFMGIFDTAAWIFYSHAVHEESISIITAITESYPAIALFLGLWLNKEKILFHQYLGAGLALVGSFVLAGTL